MQCRDETRLVIGRDPGCDVVLSAATVSSEHARLAVQDGRYLLEDLGSTNGTHVNGSSIKTAGVTPRDVILLGDTPLPWPLVLKRLQERGESGLLLETIGLGVRAPGTGRVLLDGISFSASGGQLVAVLGPSGAGKSTLLKALIGQLHPSAGSILCNGANLGESPQLLWSWVGYVPQDDIVHRELSVNDALSFASQLRLPHEKAPADTARRVLAAADKCELTRHLGKKVATLSGGERKRCSVAMELLTQPPILVFDEPTSGLDPGLERSMMSLFRRLADGGHLVLVITHATRSLDLCDRVLVLAGGREAYYGSYDRMLTHFGVTDPGELYGTLQDPVAAAERFLVSREFARFVARPISRSHPTPPPAPDRPADFREQWLILLRRYLAVLRGDTRNLAFLGLQAPVIAGIASCVFPADAFSNPENMKHTAALLFVMVMAALWFGTSNAAREIVKERSIYQRERILGISSVAYLGSKAVPLIAIGVLQSLALLFVIGLRTDWFGSAPGEQVLRLWGVLCLTSACGAGVGLLVSAGAGSPDQAMSLTPIVLLPQLVLSGIFPAVEESGAVMRLLSRLAASNWAFSAAGGALNLNARLGERPLTAMLQSEAFDRSGTACIVVLLSMLVAVLVPAWVAVRARHD